MPHTESVPPQEKSSSQDITPLQSLSFILHVPYIKGNVCKLQDKN